MRGISFGADEYENTESEGKPLPVVIAEAIESQQPGEQFFWSAWETEVVVIITILQGQDGPRFDKTTIVGKRNYGCELAIDIGQQFFIDGETSYGVQNAGVKLITDQNELHRFCEDLKTEMKTAPLKG